MEIESSINKSHEPNFCVAPSLYDKTTYYIFREVALNVWTEIKVRVMNRELVYLERLDKEEIEYFKKNII
jgi:hypothetical protein